MLQQQKQQEALLQQLVQMVQNQQLQMQEMMSLMRKGGVAPEAAAAGSDDKDRRIDALTMEVRCRGCEFVCFPERLTASQHGHVQTRAHVFCRTAALLV